ncbi:MAG: multicopper oxidase domain-containing protein [Chloroflexi bacterium]|nr:multicopper oxidase domain-containing protein [Chloroflexota bacterium]
MKGVFRWLTLAAALTVGGVLLAGCQAPGGEELSYLGASEITNLRVRLPQSERITPSGKVVSYELVARKAQWEVTRGVVADAVTYNGTVPGPVLRVTEGDTLKVVLKNELDQDTSIHWHGVHVPSAMDGVPGVTQQPVRPGETFTYEFVASHAGTFIYHPHTKSVAQIDNGLYGALIIDPRESPDPRFDREFIMVLGAWQIGRGADMQPQGGMAMAMDYNYFTINGRAYPAIEPWTVKKGDKVRVRIINISNLAHPMHLHGHDFKVVAKDGETIPSERQQVVNTVTVNAGETYDIVFIANNLGNWVFHCHELHHTENNGVEPGGLIQLIRYEGAPPLPTGQAPAAPTPMPQRMPGMGH